MWGSRVRIGATSVARSPVNEDEDLHANEEARRRNKPSQSRSDLRGSAVFQRRWSRRWDLNPRPTRYECVALPLSYSGLLAERSVRFSFFRSNGIKGDGYIRPLQFSGFFLVISPALGRAGQGHLVLCFLYLHLPHQTKSYDDKNRHKNSGNSVPHRA